MSTLLDTWKSLKSFTKSPVGTVAVGVSIGLFSINPLTALFGAAAIGYGTRVEYLRQEHEKKLDALLNNGTEALWRGHLRTDIIEKTDNIKAAIGSFGETMDQANIFNDPIRRLLSVVSDPHNIEIITQYADDDGKQRLSKVLEKGLLLSQGKDYSLTNYIEQAIQKINSSADVGIITKPSAQSYML